MVRRVHYARPELGSERVVSNRWSAATCQIYGTGVPAPPVYVTITKPSAQQPPRRPTRADTINQHGDQGKPRQVNLDDSYDQSVAHIV